MCGTELAYKCSYPPYNVLSSSSLRRATLDHIWSLQALHQRPILKAVADTICRGIADGRSLLFVREHSVIWASCISDRPQNVGLVLQLRWAAAWIPAHHGSYHTKARHCAIVCQIKGWWALMRVHTVRVFFFFNAPMNSIFGIVIYLRKE